MAARQAERDIQVSWACRGGGRRAWRVDLRGVAGRAARAHRLAYRARVRTQRAFVDYALAKRALLADLFAGRASPGEVCDAHPYLLRAAKYHGEPSERSCPVCRKEELTHVTYVYSDELKDASGHCRATDELARLATQYDELAVYVVEVCRRCEWNHLHASYALGRNGLISRARRSRRTAEQ